MTLRQQFLGLAGIRGWSPHTVDLYRRALRELPGDTPTRAELEALVVDWLGSALSPGGCNTRLRAINSYLAWLYSSGRIPTPVRAALLRARPQVVDVLSLQDIRRVMEYQPTSRRTYRTWILVQVLIDCGLRISEALGLRQSDVRGAVLHVRGKGSVPRLVPMSDLLGTRLAAYLPTVGEYLFPGVNSEPIRRTSACQDILRLCREIGITARCNPHSFRHYSASRTMPSKSVPLLMSGV